jgi:hypothetical protein
MTILLSWGHPSLSLASGNWQGFGIPRQIWSMISTLQLIDNILSGLNILWNNCEEGSGTDIFTDRIAASDITILEHGIFVAKEMILYHQFLCQSFFLMFVTSWPDTQILAGKFQQLVLVLTQLQHMIFVYHNIQLFKWMKWCYLWFSLHLIFPWAYPELYTPPPIPIGLQVVQVESDWTTRTVRQSNQTTSKVLGVQLDCYWTPTPSWNYRVLREV